MLVVQRPNPVAGAWFVGIVGILLGKSGSDDDESKDGKKVFHERSLEAAA
jgi:hypothetical protein